jgi:hypothetical protein
MAYEEKINVIDGDSVKNFSANDHVLGYSFRIKLYTYRGSYLSCIEQLNMKLNGEKVVMDQVVFKLNGKRFLVSQLKELFAEYWYVLDEAELIVLKDGGIPKGEHELEISMSIRIPYTGYFGSYMIQNALETKKIVVI